MLAFAIFAVTFVVALVAILIYLYPTTQRSTTVPGPEPSDPAKGNLDDIADAGSLHQYLMKLHDEHGDIASFYFMKQLCVSIASPQLFKEHQAVFDRPPLLFELFEPLVTLDSIQFANGADGRRRRDLTDRCFGYHALTNYVELFNKISEELVKKLSALPPDEHIPLRATGLGIALKGITRTSFGDYFKNQESLNKFRKDYDLVWEDMESRLDGNMPDLGSERQKAFDEAKERILCVTREIIELRRANPPSQDQEIFIDVLLQADYPESRLCADVLTYIIGGFHTTGNLFAWALYFLAKDEAIQQKLCDHVTSIAGKTGDITVEDVSEMKYLKQIIDETLRVSILAPYAARFQDFDITLGGHVIPKGTPVVHALGVSLQSESAYPNAKVFNPDNFSPENVKKRDRYAFQPFGFAGKRVCPGQQFAYKEISIFLATLIRSLRVKLVPGQALEHVHGLVSYLHNKDGGDVWVTVEKR